MATPYEEHLASLTGPKNLPAPAPVENAGFLDRAGDTGIDLLSGAIALPEAFVGLADIPTGGHVGKFLEESIGYKPAEAKEILSQFYSDERKAEEAAVSRSFEEEGFFSGIGEALSEPATAAGAILQSIPTMLAGGVGAGALAKAVPKMAPWVAAAIGEGTLGAGAAAESTRVQNEDRLLTLEQSLLSLASGAGTGFFSAVGGKIAQRYGLQDIDVLGNKPKVSGDVKGNFIEKAAKGVISEGFLEELPQSIQEQILSNVANDREWNEGVEEAAGLGLIAGSTMGAGMGVKTHFDNKVNKAKDDMAKGIVDEAKAKIDNIAEQNAEAVKSGKASVSLTDNAKTEGEVKQEAQTVQQTETITQETVEQVKVVNDEADGILLTNIADKIVSGNTEFTPEELQYQANNPEALEGELTQRQEAIQSSKDHTIHEKAAALELNADPSVFRQIYTSAKNFKEFSAGLVKRFGQAAKKHALKLYNSLKNMHLFADQTGAIGKDIRKAQQKEADLVTDPGRTETETAALQQERAEQLRREDMKSFEEEVGPVSMTNEEFQFVPEDEAIEGDEVFPPKRQAADTDIVYEDNLHASEKDPFRFIKTRSALYEKARLKNPKTKQPMALPAETVAAIDTKLKKSNAQEQEIIRRQLANNEAFSIQGQLDETTGELGASMADIIESDIASLGSDMLLQDVVKHIKFAEGIDPKDSLSKLTGYPESLSALLSHKESLSEAGDFDFVQPTEFSPRKEAIYKEIKETFTDKEITRNSRAIDLIGTNPKALIEFIETEVHQSWEYTKGDLIKMNKAFNDEFNANLTPKMAAFLIEKVKSGEIIEEEAESEVDKELADTELSIKLLRHMTKNDITRALNAKELAAREEKSVNKEQSRKLAHDHFKSVVTEKQKIDSDVWKAFYRSVAELAGRGVGMQSNPLNVDNLVTIVSQKAGGEFAALQPAAQKKLVVTMIQNSYIENGDFEYSPVTKESLGQQPASDESAFIVWQPDGKGGTKSEVMTKTQLVEAAKKTPELRTGKKKFRDESPYGFRAVDQVEGTTSTYSIVTENTDLDRQATQLGELAEAIQADPTTTRPSKQKTINLRTDVELYQVEYKSGSKTINVTVDTDRLNDLIEKHPEILEKKQFSSIGKHDIVSDWNHPKDIDSIIELANNSGVIHAAAQANDMTTDQYMQTMHDLSQTVYLVREASPSLKTAQRELKKQAMLIKSLLAEDQYNKNQITDPAFFDKLAVENKYLGLTGDELHAVYQQVGADKALFRSRLFIMVEAKHQDAADRSFAKLQFEGKEASQEAIDDYVTNRMSELQKTAYQDVLSGKIELDSLDPNTKPTVFTAIDIATRIKAKGIDAMNRETSVATQKNDSFVKVEIEDLLSYKRVDPADDFSRELIADDLRRATHDGRAADLKIGVLRNTVSQRFYENMAKVFNADLVIVSGSDYQSRYIGEASDGRPKIVINMRAGKAFNGVFAHELFHHVVNKAVPAQYNAFKDSIKPYVSEEKWNAAIDREMKVRGVSEKVAEEEVLASLFVSVMSQRDFYDNLSRTFPGKTLAGKLISRLVKLAGKISGLTNSTKKAFFHEGQMLIGKESMSDIYSLVNDLVLGDPLVKDGKIIGRYGGTGRYNTTQHGEIRYNTALGPRTLKELEGYLATPKNWLKGMWGKIFKPGTKSYKDLMTNIEGIIVDTIMWIKENKPKFAFADFMADPAQTALANRLAHEAKAAVAKAKAQVVNKHKDVFKEMTDQQKETMHDDLVRGTIDVSTEEGAAKAKELGYSNEVIQTFKDYKTAADSLYKELQKVFPNLPKLESHYGQSIRWSKEDGSFLDEEFDWALNPEFSKLAGSKHYEKNKDLYTTTRDIAENGKLKYRTIDPHALFLEYILEANKALTLYNVLKDGSTTFDQDGKPMVKIFRNQLSAAQGEYYPVEDNALKVMQKLGVAIGFKVKVGDAYHQVSGQDALYTTRTEAQEAIDAYVKVASPAGPQQISIEEVTQDTTQTTESYSVFVVQEGKEQELASLPNKKAAEKLVAEVEANGGVATIKANQSEGEYSQVAQVYFSKDLARMVNNLLAKDYIRSTNLGAGLMNLKNKMTSIEFAFSMFHMLTIGQELIASYASWGFSRRKTKGFGPKAIKNSYKESVELAMLVQALEGSPELALDPAVIKMSERLLGTTDIDLLEVAKQWRLVGGEFHQDTDLQSNVRKMGEVRYRTTERKLRVEGDEAFVDGKRPLAEATADLGRALKDSVKEVYEQQVKNHPDQKAKALFNSMQFAFMETTSAWLMENTIPKIKMAMWFREYTLKIENNQAKIDAGLTSKEEIAHDTMKFIEDRFGEVNWANQWMKPTLKTALQFTFRSFTWFTGSWKALAKAGIDIGKLGWFTAKGEKYELTEKGQWGINALFAHFLTVGLATTAYSAALLASGGSEVPDDEETPLLTKMLFPRSDSQDPRQRLSIPSYITEGYKIMRHIGVIGNEAEYLKLVSGRTNSLLNNTIEALYAGEDWRGVSVRDPDSGKVKQTIDTLWHIFGVAPISFSTISKSFENKGFDPYSIATAALGMTGAPAASKRSDATNKAFELRRKEFKGKAVTQDVMDEKAEVKRAMHAYQLGDKTKLNKLYRDGKISKRQYDNAITKIPMIGKRKNPKFVDELSRALRGLTLDAAIEVWGHMSDSEKKLHKREIIKKYMNMMARKDKSRKYKKEIRVELKDSGIF